MSRSLRPNKEARKQATRTPKEKKAAKQAKKDAGHFVPFVVKH